MIHDDNIIILVSLPLLDSGGQFEVYQVLDMPVPYLATNLTASYDLEFRNFGISKDRTRYIVLIKGNIPRISSYTWRFAINTGWFVVLRSNP